MLPMAWKVQDEMHGVHLYPFNANSSFDRPLHNRYNFKSDPRELGAVVVLAANESSYVG